MRIAVDGTRLFFDVEGAALVPDGPRMRARPTIVALHGGPGGDHSEYKPFLSALADVAQIVYLDLRGQGRSDEADPAEWTLARWADDVRAFCEALEIARPIVLGASFGSFVALTYAIRHPDHPAAIALLATAARNDPARIAAAFERFGGSEQRRAAERFLADPSEERQRAFRAACRPLYALAPADEEAAARTVARPEVSRRFFAHEGTTFDLRAGAAGVRCPVLVIAGERDPITPVEAARELADAFPPRLVELVEIPHAAHEVTLDAPELVRAHLRRFATRKSQSQDNCPSPG